ncbi:major capsid protein [Tortoise microvirus 66]|nr:major capsid protein [Tortoise microvirus 66]
MDRRLSAPDSGSNYKFQNQLEIASPPRSLFDLSHLHTTTIPSIGVVIPIACFETLPNDSFELSVTALVRALPQVVPLYSRQRITIHAFWNSLSDLWTHAEVFMTKGYTGNTIYQIPFLAHSETDYVSFPHTGRVQAHSLLGFLCSGTVGHLYGDLTGEHFNALPLFMYFKIWRDYYVNKNLFNDNRAMFPDDDCDFRLNDKGGIVSFINSAALYYPNGLRSRFFADDYFTSAYPSPQRGTAPTLDFTASLSDIFNVDAATRFTPLWQALSSSETTVNVITGAPGTPGILPTGFSHTSLIDDYAERNARFLEHMNQALSDSSMLNSSITLNQLRELAISQSELERMAKTDGSYSDFGLTFFGQKPRNASIRKAVYIGGTQQPIMYSEVLQTSHSESTPLGTYAGHGISQSNGGYIGKFDCSDYGYLMILASVVPDTYYSQGLDLMWTRSFQSEMYLPDRARLGLRPILSKELYFGSVGNDELFAYQNPFDEFRYCPNRVSGYIADSTKDSYFAYTQSRFFTSRPTYSQSFMSMADNVRMDYLVSKTEPPFTAQFSINCRAVRPLPYRPIPATLGV